METKAEIDRCYPDSSESIGMIYKWYAEFRSGRLTTNDAVRSGRPKTATTPEMIEKVDNIVIEDRRVKVVEIADILKISPERVEKILLEDLGMKKIS